ncbi:MAG: S-layer homology domain-containing protein [Oscillibacter sp.]|nr:S-layer homology domain-containing protein [Oscillibacter sp.]
MKRKLAGLLAALLLCSCAGPGAFAANQSFKDLPASHWAYQEITRAVTYGIMNGLGDGSMNPDGTLTWAHYLAMISRTFAPMAYEGARSSGTDWRTAGYQTALDKGYLISGDFLTVTPSTLNEPISRQDVAVLLSRTLPAARSNASAYGDSSGAFGNNGGNGAGNVSGGGNSGNVSGGGNSGNSSGGGSTIDAGDGAGIQIVTDSNGRIWIVKDGVSIPLSQSVEIVVHGDSVQDKAKEGRNTLDVVASKPDSENGNAFKKQTSANYPTTRKANDDGDTTAPSGSSVKRVNTVSGDDGETTAASGSSVKRTNNASDDGDTTAPSGSNRQRSGYDTPVIAPAPVTPAPVTVSNPPLSDFDQMDANHQAAVRRLYELNIVRGKSDGSFGPTDTVRRSDGAVLLMRTLDATDELRSGETVSLTLELVDGDGKAVAETVTGNGRINQSLSSLASVYAPTGYKVAPPDGKVSVITKRYALKFAPLTQAEKEEIEATAQYRNGQITEEEYRAKDFWLKKLGDNSRKRLLIYGAEYTETIEVPVTPEPVDSAENPDALTPVDGAESATPVDPATPQTRLETVTRTEIRYDSDEEAKSHMASVEVPVWRLRGNSKTPGTLSLTVNAALAEEVKAIFTEIYNDPEQFPISDGGGYSWRANSGSEHILGTAIDLNVDSNYQVRDGVALVGSGWTPGEDPYSITPGGSVVRIFAEHGWDWGGNAWAGHSDQTYGYHDYMHFSYFGR